MRMMQETVAGQSLIKPLNTKSLVRYAHPALFSVTVAFISIWFFSIIDNSKRATAERAMFRAQNVRANTGIGSAGAVSH